MQRLGYKVGLNLPQISEISTEDLLIASKKISKSNIDVFYFADSLGSLNSEQVKRLKLLKLIGMI